MNGRVGQSMRLRMRSGMVAGLAIAAAALAGCSGSDKPEAAGNEKQETQSGPARPVRTERLEPGETIQTAAKTTIGTVVTGEIVADGPNDFFYFANPAKLRDRVVVKLANKSTTLKPRVNVYNDSKSKIYEAYDFTEGADLEFSLVLDPGQGLYVEVERGNYGAYELSVIAQKAYDQYEANDDQFTATPVNFGDSVEASLLDGKDYDWFHVTPTPNGRVTIAFENLSTTLYPRVNVYNAQKSKVAGEVDYTIGAGLDFDAKLPENQDFYVEVEPFSSEGGAYRLTVRPTVLASDLAKAIETAGSVNIYGVYFDVDQAFVKPESASTLAEVASLLKADPALRLEIVGHTDDSGTDAHNMRLSQARAEAVVNALVSRHGIDAARLAARGAGEAQPVAPNDTVSGKAKNRRVELRRA